MTVATDLNTVSYTGNGATTVFPFTFTVLDEDHLAVYERVIATGVNTLLDPAAYTVTGVPGTGSVTYNPDGVPLPATKKLVLLRTVPLTQGMDIENQGGFFPEVLEDQLDQIVMGLQQVAEEIGRAVVSSPGGTGIDADAYLASLAAEADAAAEAQAAAEEARDATLAIPNTSLITATGATTPRTLSNRFADLPFVEDWGALGDGSNDDLASVQAAITAERRVFFRNENYILDGQLLLPNKQQLHGFGYGAGSASAGGAPKLIFTGAADSCFANAVPSVFIGHGGFHGIAIYATGEYDWMLDLNGCIAWHLNGCHMETTSTATGGFRSQKIAPSDPSWLNLISEGTSIILPDGSTARPLEHDWSDSRVIGSSLSGGIGTLDQGYGTQYLLNNIERSTGDAGITLLKRTSSVSSVLIGNFIDANAVCGVLIDVTDDPTVNYAIAHLVQSNQFRTVHPDTGVAGTADIMFVNPSANVYKGGQISGNNHRVSAVPELSIDSTKWNDISFGPRTHVNTGGDRFGYGDELNYFAGYDGLNIPRGPAVVRGTETLRGTTGASGFFGSPGTGPGAVLGSKAGVAPFIAASKDASDVATDLRVYTDDTDRWHFMNTGHLRPATDNTLDIGTTTFRPRKSYTGVVALIDGVTAPTTIAGHAQIYVDAADGDLKIKFGDGTVKTISVDT